MAPLAALAAPADPLTPAVLVALALQASPALSAAPSVQASSARHAGGTSDISGIREKLAGCLPAKPVVVFKPESAHFGDYRRCRSSHFVTGFAGIWHKREKVQKMSKNVKKHPKSLRRSKVSTFFIFSRFCQIPAKPVTKRELQQRR